MKQFIEILLGLKPGELVGAAGARIELVGLPGDGWSVLALIALGAAMIWLTVRSYLREGDAPRRVKGVLAGVRIAVIVTLLIMLCQPAIVLKRVRTETSAVVVLVDDSLSMSMTDPPEIPGGKRKMRWDRVRETLGGSGDTLEPLRRDHALWVLAFGSDSTDLAAPARLLGVWNPLTGDVAPPRPPSDMGIRIAAIVVIVAGVWLALMLVYVLWAAIRRRAVAGPSGPAPWLVVVSVAAMIVGCVAGAYAINARRAINTLSDTPNTGQSTGGDVAGEIHAALADVTGTGLRTDLVRAVRDGLDRASGRRIAAVVLITDGQHTTDQQGGDSVQAERIGGLRDDMRAAGIRLITVQVGDDTPRLNLRVASLTLPEGAQVGATSSARVAVEGVHCTGQTAVVRLDRRRGDDALWTPVGEPSRVERTPAGAKADGGRFTATATFELTHDSIGDYVYRATVDPADGEVLIDDNQTQSRLTVTDRKIRVLLVSADAGWEFRYLRNFLLRDSVTRRVDGELRSETRFDVSLWQQNAGVQMSQWATPGMRLKSLPRELSELVEQFDVVLLYDPAHTVDGFDATFVAMLKEFVSTHRGGLGYIASNKHTSENLLVSGQFDDLAAMLPVQVGRDLHRIAARIGRDTRTGWPLRLTGAGRDHEVMRLDGDPATSRRMWGDLPGLFWVHPIASVKPGGVPLAVSSDPTELSQENQPLPLVVTQLYGRGPVLYVGFDSTWRWRFVDEGEYFRRFWSNAITHLASYRQERRRIRLSVGAETFDRGAGVELTAEAYDSKFEPMADATLAVQVTHTESGATQSVDLNRLEAPPGATRPLPMYKRTITLAEQGEYHLTVANVSGDDVRDVYFTVIRPQGELESPEANPALLATLATPGDAIMLGEFSTLSDRIAPDRRRLVELTTRDLWTVWLAMVVLVTLLIAEWIGRKRYNMA